MTLALLVPRVTPWKRGSLPCEIRSREQASHHAAMHIREAVVTAFGAEGEVLVI